MTRLTVLTVIGRVVLAIVIPAGAFWLKTVRTPAEYDLGVVQYLAATLDLPVSGMNWLLPEALRTHLSMYRPCGHTYCFPANPAVETFRYVRAGFPAYLAILFLPGVVVGVMSRRGRERGIYNGPPK